MARNNQFKGRIIVCRRGHSYTPKHRRSVLKLKLAKGKKGWLIASDMAGESGAFYQAREDQKTFGVLRAILNPPYIYSIIFILYFINPTFLLLIEEHIVWHII